MASSICDTFVKLLSTHLHPDDQISSIVCAPNDPPFTSLLQSYVKNRRFNSPSTPKPALIITPLRESHVRAAVICAKIAGVQIKIRSGGHDYEGISYLSETAFALLDLFNLRSVEVDLADEEVRVQAGATLGELYYRIWEKSGVHGFPAGVGPTVGVGGHFSGAGYGNMLRKYGLSVDHVIDARIVNANGEILDREAMGEDLFWAINGGGGASFGIILSYTIKIVRVPEIVTVFRLKRMMEENATVLVHQWQYVSNTVDNDLFIRLLLQPIDSGDNNGQKTVRASFVSLFLGDADTLLGIMNKEFPELRLKKEDCKEMSWIESILYWANFDPSSPLDILLDRHSDTVKFLKRKSDYVQTPISLEGLNLIFQKLIELGKPGLVFNPYGGRMAEVSSSETPFPHRAGVLYKIQYSVNWREEGIEIEEKYLNQIRVLYDCLTPFVSKSPRRAYLNYRDLDIGVNTNGKNSCSEGKVYGSKYFMGNFERLVKVKTLVDPDNFFRHEQSIPTLPVGNASK